MIGDKIYIEEKKPKARNALWIHHCEYNCIDSPFVCHYIDHRGITSPVVGGDIEAFVKLFRDLSNRTTASIDDAHQQIEDMIDRVETNEQDFNDLKDTVQTMQEELVPMTDEEINNLT